MSDKVKNLGRESPDIQQCLDEMEISCVDLGRLLFDSIARAGQGYRMMDYALAAINRRGEASSFFEPVDPRCQGMVRDTI